MSQLPSARYRDHHADLARLAQHVTACLPVSTQSPDLTTIRQNLTAFTAKLRVHLALEDDALYPRLFRHDNGRIRQTADQFSREMGDLRAGYDEHIRIWSNAAIAQDPIGFSQTTRTMLETLMARMGREDHQLYPLLDQIGL